MSEFDRPAVPVWYWVIAILLTLWGAMGCFACYQQFKLGPAAWGEVTDYSRALYASLPVWYNWLYALAVGTALLGGIGLLLRAGWAKAAFWISLIAAVVQFGYAFAATDMVAVKGAAATLPFPIFIIAVAVFSVWFAGFAKGRGWLR